LETLASPLPPFAPPPFFPSRSPLSVNKMKGKTPHYLTATTMAPPLQAAPRRVEGTRRCASSSSTSWCEESSPRASNRRQNRGIPSPAAALRRELRPLWPSPGFPDLSISFTVKFSFSRTSPSSLSPSQSTCPR
jgi:hypothetical protein